MRLLDFCLELEAQWDRLTKEERWARLQSTRQMLSELTTHPELEYQKLSQLTRCIRAEMELRDFYSVLVPIERLERRKTTDSQFLISSTDRAPERAQSREGLILVLDNIRSAFNIGAMARVADCVGARAIYTCGYTAGPDHPQVAKSALGSHTSLSWQSFTRLDEALSKLREMGYQIFALETAVHSQNLYSAKLSSDSAFVFGNERFGLDGATLARCDAVLQIPTFGRKNSLNVATSFALTAYEWKKQNAPELFL